MTQLRYALRSLSRTPALTSVVVLSLGLGIGANTAIFSLLHQILLRSLSVERPEELAVLTSPAQFKSGRSSTNNSGNMESIFSYFVFRELEKSAQGVSYLAGFRDGMGVNLNFENQTVNASAVLVSGNYFPMLGVKPLFGRTIERADDVHGAGNPVAMLGYGYWQHRLGGRREVLNQTIRVNTEAFTIVGVAPKNFNGTTLGGDPDIYLPISFKPRVTPGWNGTDRWDDYWVYLLARRKPGMSLAQTQDALNSVYAGIVEEQQKALPQRDDSGKRFLASRLTLKDGRQGQSSMRDGSRTPLFILMASTALVLLIAMANAANLLLARSAQRRKELAIRTALGAGRRDIMGQLLAEAIALSMAGGVAGILLGRWTLNLLLATTSRAERPEYFLTAELQWPVLLFTLGLSVFTGLLFGLHPAWQAARVTVADTLKDDAGSVSMSHGSVRARKVLVGMQVAISALLLVPTGLFLKSLVNLMHVDLGIKTQNLITFRLSPRLNGYTPEQARALFERVEEQMAAIPGVSSVAVSMVPLISGSNWGGNLTVEGYARGPNAARDTHSMFSDVGAGFFGKMGIPLIAGREFDERDNLAGPKVAVVNEQFARHFFGSANPLGRKFCPGWGKVTPDIEIVGVIKNSSYAGVKQEIPRVYYTPWRQNKRPDSLSFYLRTALDPRQVMPQVRREMSSIDRDLPLEGMRTFEEQVRQNVRNDRLMLQLAASFAILATAMAMLGLYGVMAFSVTRRTREIGIRLALGAVPHRIRAMVFRELLVILGVGLLIGIPAAVGVVRLAESQLFGVKSSDALVMGAAAAALVLAALAAGYFPARRATRVNPIDALRYE